MKNVLLALAFLASSEAALAAPVSSRASKLAACESLKNAASSLTIMSRVRDRQANDFLAFHNTEEPQLTANVDENSKAIIASYDALRSQMLSEQLSAANNMDHIVIGVDKDIEDLCVSSRPIGKEGRAP